MTSIQKREILHLRGQGLSYGKIAATVGLPKNTIKTFCWRNKQDTEAAPTGQCPQCDKALEQIPQQKPRRFCCDQCRRAWWNAHRDLMKHRSSYITMCCYCGVKFDNRGDVKRRYCCHPCYINARFGGGEPS